MMYLLLRDNKQSGPYSLDELKAKGLKAYDLVWVEGKSAAWRYPSEIEEMKAFAPAVEEQPFDRFFKKPAAAKQVNAIADIGIPEGTTAVTMTQPASASNPTAIRRTIYVTMPGGIVARENMRDTPLAREASPIRDASPTREPSATREPIATREPSAARESTPARDIIREITPVRERMSYIGEPVSEILPPLPRRRTTNIWIPVGIGGGVVLLLAVGIFIGLSIQKDSGNVQKLAAHDTKENGQPIVRTAAQQVPVSPANNLANNPAGNSVTAPTTTSPQTTSPAQDAITPPNDKALVRQRTTAHQQKPEAPKGDVPAGPAGSALDSQPVGPVSAAGGANGGHREAVHRTDVVQSQPADDREGARTALANEISVGTNKYDVGTFGGIHNLQVTVTNRSAYSLDLVIVAVSYVQANKKTYKTENLYFRGIGPGSALMLEAPKSSRGISVQYKVTSINSKELGLSEPGI